VRMANGRLRTRAAYVVKASLLARRGDGRFHPAFARYAGNVFNNVIENAWLPPSETTVGQTVWRSTAGILTRIGDSALKEFWPDVSRLLKKRE